MGGGRGQARKHHDVIDIDSLKKTALAAVLTQTTKGGGHRKKYS